ATGVSIGLERIIDAGLELGVYSLDRKTVTRAAVVVLDREAYSYAWRVASELRRGGVNTRIDLSRASGQVQRRKALKMGIEILVFVGPREASRGTATVYNVRSGERVEAGLEDVVKVVLEAIG
ncbi:MAG: histidine--tRNA ligase, partial [Aeropyrum sp.]|nr:histidine--tRNA ligase [Aeropyrum sp.]